MAEGGSVWTEIVLETLRERPWKDGKGFGCWVVQKVKDGKSFEVTVRAGMYRTDKVTGAKVLPKDGLTKADFDLLKPTYQSKIVPMLEIKKGTPVAQAEQAPPPEPEMPPW